MKFAADRIDEKLFDVPKQCNRNTIHSYQSMQTSHTLTVGCGSPSMRILQHCYYGNCLNRGRSLLARKHGKLQDGCNVSIHVLHSVGNYDLKITEIVRRGTSMHGSAIYNLQLTN